MVRRKIFFSGNTLVPTSMMHWGHRKSIWLESRTMFHFPDRYDAFLASPMTSKYMETLICDKSAMTYCFYIPCDMNHPITTNQESHIDQFVENEYQQPFFEKSAKSSFPWLQANWLPISFYIETLIRDGSPINRRCIAGSLRLYGK